MATLETQSVTPPLTESVPPDSPEPTNSPELTRLDNADSYAESVKRVCHPEPLIETTVLTTSKPDYAFLLTVKVYRANYGAYLYYSITCDIAWTGIDQWVHPFTHLDRYDGSNVTEIWNVVADNDLARRLLEYIAMPDTELQPRIGHTCPIGYRACLIRAIRDLWD